MFIRAINNIIIVVIIIICLVIVSNLIIGAIESLFNNIFSFMPNNVFLFISRLIASILGIVCLIASIIILVHIFKTRYLDYYIKTKKDDTKIIEEKKEVDNNQPVELKEKKAELKKEDKIVIRDPKHSEYRFINGLFKIFIIVIKMFALLFALCIAFALIGLFGSLILSFLVYKTGTFFIGLLLSILSSVVIAIIILLLILNFIFDRKNDKKKMIWSFIISLAFFGIGCGLIVNGALNFEVLDNNEAMLKTVKKEHKMSKGLVISPYTNGIKYVEKNIDNIQIEYSINKYCEVQEFNDQEITNKVIAANYNCQNITGLAKEVLKNINDKKIIPLNLDIDSVTIYASKENISKLKNNLEKYEERVSNLREENANLNNRINELEEENANLHERINELEINTNE